MAGREHDLALVVDDAVERADRPVDKLLDDHAGMHRFQHPLQFLRVVNPHRIVGADAAVRLSNQRIIDRLGKAADFVFILADQPARRRHARFGIFGLHQRHELTDVEPPGNIPS